VKVHILGGLSSRSGEESKGYNVTFSPSLIRNVLAHACYPFLLSTSAKSSKKRQLWCEFSEASSSTDMALKSVF